MRGAGCTLNDIADRAFDAQVARTAAAAPAERRASRVRQALRSSWLLQLAIGAAVLLSLNRTSHLPRRRRSLGADRRLPLHEADHLLAASLPRPQLQLGGAARLDGGHRQPRPGRRCCSISAASSGRSATTRSTPIRTRRTTPASASNPRRLALGARTRPWLFVFYAAALSLWRGGGLGRRARLLFWVGLAASPRSLAGRRSRVDIDDPADCLAKFRSNRVVGWLMLGGIIAGHFG